MLFNIIRKMRMFLPFKVALIIIIFALVIELALLLGNKERWNNEDGNK